jgi:hypothetical protein
MGRETSGSKITFYGPDDSGSFRGRGRDFTRRKHVQTSSGSQPSNSVNTGGLYLLKYSHLERKVDHSHLLSGVMNA